MKTRTLLASGLLVMGWTAGCLLTPKGGSTPTWWRGNTHTHTLWSDGNGAPEFAAQWYASRDYDFLVLSDHNILSAGERWFSVDEKGRLTADRVAQLTALFGDDWVEERTTNGQREMRLKTLEELRAHFEQPGEFIFIQGEEITDSFERRPVHVNGLNTAELIDPPHGTSVLNTMQNIVDAVAAQAARLERPMLAHINHPNFGWGIRPEELAQLRGAAFFEVYNGHPGVRNWGDDKHPSTAAMWDFANTMRLSELGLAPLFAVATDDTHHYFEMALKQSNPGAGWIMVRAQELDADAIIEAMGRGDFYASSGVTLNDIQRDEEKLVIDIAREDGVNYLTEFIGTRRAVGGLGPIGEVLDTSHASPAVYDFAGDELFVRAKVTSSRLHPAPFAEGDMESAWTQPLIP
ncbi:MAG TPA: histidinol-phosphatase [Planctomycetota bacterium]|nr:histidinol-phosphatase [Planctomycetota bacterium]